MRFALSQATEEVQAAPDFPFEHALAGTILIAATIAAMPVVWMIVRRLFGGRNVFFARWGFSHLLAVVLLAVSLSIAVSAVSAGHLDPESPDLALVLGLTAVVYGFTSLFVSWLAQRLDPDGWRSLGFRRGGNRRALLAGLLAYFAIAPGLFGVGQLWPYLLERFGEPIEEQVFVPLFSEARGASLWIGVVLAVLVVPLFEEVLFRGFLQPLLVQNFRDEGGVVLTAVIFAALHGQTAFLPIFALALLLGALMLRTQRLVAVWGVHAMHNGLQVLILMLGSGAEGASGLLGLG